MVFLTVLVALFTMAAPDSCLDDLSIDVLAAGVATGPSNADHYGCTMEEDCFCCAHIAPARTFVLSAQITEAALIPSAADPFVLAAGSVPTYHTYHPPPLFTEIRS
jgi:hypothetical protein